MDGMEFNLAPSLASLFTVAIGEEEEAVEVKQPVALGGIIEMEEAEEASLSFHFQASEANLERFPTFFPYFSIHLHKLIKSSIQSFLDKRANSWLHPRLGLIRKV